MILAATGPPPSPASCTPQDCAHATAAFGLAWLLAAAAVLGAVALRVRSRRRRAKTAAASAKPRRRWRGWAVAALLVVIALVGLAAQTGGHR